MSQPIHLIGGCGSSGTTLLAYLLDGMHDLRSGPESGLFHHRILYNAQSFPTALQNCLEDRAPTRNIVVNRLQVPLVPRVFFMDREFYGLANPDSEQELRSNGLELGTFLDFIQHRMAVTQSIQEPFTWIDQTPKNCIAAREFLMSRPQACFIHLIRDGRDVMLSLARRWAREAPGHPAGTYLGAAAARWTYDVTQAKRAASLPGYLEIRYEDLVQSPLTTLNRILDHLGRPPTTKEAIELHKSPSAAAAGERFHGGRKQSWGAQPGQAIQTTGVGRWRREMNPAIVDKLIDFQFTIPGDERAYHFGQVLESTHYD